MNKVGTILFIVIVALAAVGATYVLSQENSDDVSMTRSKTEDANGKQESSPRSATSIPLETTTGKSAAAHVVPAKTSLEGIESAERADVELVKLPTDEEKSTTSEEAKPDDDDPEVRRLSDAVELLGDDISDLRRMFEGADGFGGPGTPFSVQLQGRVVDEASNPVEGVKISGSGGVSSGAASFEFEVGGISESSMPVRTKGDAQSAADGTFTITLSGSLPSWIDDDNKAGLSISLEKSGYAKSSSEHITYTKDAELPKVQVTLYRGASIKGQVLDKSTKEPFSGAGIRVRQTKSANPKTTLAQGYTALKVRSASASASTNAEGNFSFTGLVDGTFEVEASTSSSEGTSAMIRTTMVLDGAMFGGSSGEEGTKTTVTITGGVDPSPVTLYLVRDASLRFTLAHAAEGLQYRLKEATNNGAVFFGGDFLGSTAMTDLSVGSDGAYHVSTVKSKHRTITLRASGYTETDFSFIPVPGEEVDLGRLELKPGIRILGKVTDAQGNSLAGVSIRMEGGKRSGFGEVVTFVGMQASTPTPGTEKTKTGEDGSYVVDSLSEGKVTLYASLRDFALGRQEITLTLDHPEVVQDFILSQGGTVQGSSTLPEFPESSTSDERRTIRFGGVMQDFVGLIGENSSTGGNSFSQHTDAEVSRASKSAYKANLAADGTFTISNVPEGTYTLVGSYKGLKGRADNVTVSEGGTVSVHLIFAQGGTIYGRVLDKNGSPMTLTKVSIQERSSWMASDSQSSITDAGGFYEIRNVPVGPIVVVLQDETIRAYNQSFRDKRTVQVSEGGRHELNIDLSETSGVRVHGTLTLNGNPIFNQVSLVGTGSNQLGDIKSDGTYEITDVAPGSYELLAYGWGSGTNSSSRADITISDGITELEFNKDWRGFTVSGTVTSAVETTDFTLASISLKFVNPDGSESRTSGWGLGSSASVQSNGTFQSDAVAEGSYEVVLTHPDFAPVKQTINLISDVTLNLQLSALAGSIEVVVKTLPEASLDLNESFCVIRLTDVGGQDATPTNGAYLYVRGVGSSQLLNSIPVGTYTVTITGSGYQTVTSTATVSANSKTTVELHFVAAARFTISLSGEGFSAQNLTGVPLMVTSVSGGQQLPAEKAYLTGTTIYGNGLSAGSYRIQLNVPGFQSVDQIVTLSEGQRHVETITMTAVGG